MTQSQYTPKAIFPISFIIIIIVFWCFSQPQPAAALQVTAVGDIYISQQLIDHHNSDILKINLYGDIVFANFEGVLSNTHSRKNTLKLKLTMPPTVVDTLKQIGINTLSLANNHVLDMGHEQYKHTFAELENRSFYVAGLNDNGKVISINNVNIRFIAFSFTGANNINDLERVAKLIRSFREDIIIVSAHMGAEDFTSYRIPVGIEYYNNEQRGDVRKFARTCIDAGASLIIGHGTHILRGIELYKNKLIVYSLGNFIFDYPGVNKHGNTPSLSISINLTQNGDFQYAQILSYIFRYGIPHLDNKKRTCSIINTLSMELDNKSLIIDADCFVYKKGGEI